MENSIYYKSFIFEVNRFEEYQDGKCISKGASNTKIIAKVLNPETIEFVL